MSRFSFLLVLIFYTTFQLSGQVDILTKSKNQSPTFHFKAHPNQKYGFDAYEFNEWKDDYQPFQSNGIYPVYSSHKSVDFKDRDRVLLVFKGAKRINVKNLKITIRNKNVAFTKIDDSTFTVGLPPKESDYLVKAFWKDEVVAKMFVQVKKQVHEKIRIIPLNDFQFSGTKIQENINSIYKQANIQFDVEIEKPFLSKVFEPQTVFSNPINNHNEYSGQMRLLRDLYFEEHPKIDKNAYFIFVINGFTDSLLNGFMVKNKSVGFIKYQQNIDSFSLFLAKNLGFGAGTLDYSWENKGPEMGSTFNLMDTTFGTHLAYFQWNSLHKMTNYYSCYDNEENIKTNNGTVAYYFWEENKKGNIYFKNNSVLDAVKRPFKYNFLAYRFKVKYLLLRPFYKLGDYFVSILDLILIAIVLFLLWFISKKLKQFWVRKKWRFKIIRRLLFFSILCFIAFETYENYWVTNRILFFFKQISGPLKELDNLPYSIAQEQLVKDEKLLHQEVSTVCSEILIKRTKSWYVKKRSKVLYFNVSMDQNNKIEKIRYDLSSDSIHLKTINYHQKASSHYVVFTYKKTGKSAERQEIYNHLGIELSSKFKNENPSKRILVFVNGYRPTSIGRTFEENFSDVQNNGFEYSNSKNYIYDFDRFDYWRPWREINLLFQKRLNPNETYYADGHFSVETSNYRSLLNFSSISSLYPKRCKNPKKHTCHKIQDATFKQFIFNQSKTINQLKMRPNKKGFNLRKYKGRIAGKNLLQIVNEIPNFSKNDTLYIVTHSMGFAYSQGIIEELRNKINFGGYYIIAPENGESGKVNPSEWKEIWQYGSDFDQKKHDAPCLQDGIAPQRIIPGLPRKNRVFIPEKLYRCKGYFDSHFIGYYTWVLDLKKDEQGFVTKK